MGKICNRFYPILLINFCEIGENIDMTTFERIKLLAKKKGLSLQKVAENSDIGINTIYKWKNYDPKGTDLSKVATILHTTTDYLLGRTDNPNPPLDNDAPGIEWSDLGMAYGGKIPKDLKGMYKAIAQQYVKDHPESIKKDDDD